VIKSRRIRNIQPAEMIRITLRAAELEALDWAAVPCLKIEIR